MKYLAIDLETAGIKPPYQILEIGMVGWNSNAEGCSKPITLNYRLQSVGINNCYEIEQSTFWFHRSCNCKATAEMVDLSTLRKHVDTFMRSLADLHGSKEKITLVGKDPEFDLAFMDHFFSFRSLFEPILERRTIDIGTLAWNPVTDTQIPNSEETARRFGVAAGDHSALADAMMCYEVIDAYHKKKMVDGPEKPQAPTMWEMKYES